MKKNIKKILKVLGIFLLIILVALIAYLIYLFASYHRIPDNQALKIEKTSGGTAAADTLTTEKEYSAQCWFRSLHAGLQLLYGRGKIFLGKK